MTVVGLLHTSAVHVAAFEALLAAAAPDLATRHVVDAGLLDRARSHGLDEEVRDGLAARLIEAGRGAAAVLCTCSTLAGLAEDLGPRLQISLVRIDRPLAERAVALASYAAGSSGPRGRPGRIGVVTALASTLAPTRTLLTSVAAAAGVQVELVDLPVPQAWSCFEAGDVAGYHREIADHLRASSRAEPLDVLVLAQASMAPAADLVAADPPVLSSPGLAVAALVEASGSRPADRAPGR